MPNYNRIANVYDRLSRLVYGNAIVRAQQYLVSFIPANSRILIVGGGTGWILEEITKLHPQGLEIYYVEIADKMLELSRKRNIGNNKVHFIGKSIEELEDIGGIDVAFTAFLFDNFTQQTANDIFKNMERRLVAGALWLYSDFQVSSKQMWWQKPLLHSMLLFFRTMGVISNDQLPDMQSIFQREGFTLKSREEFYGHFVASAVYTRS
jgi:ubiquinone/menaquinone biosynthesis C-methylase UbiE